jgi:hypothetical protein
LLIGLRTARRASGLLAPIASPRRTKSSDVAARALVAAFRGEQPPRGSAQRGRLSGIAATSGCPSPTTAAGRHDRSSGSRHEANASVINLGSVQYMGDDPRDAESSYSAAIA